MLINGTDYKVAHRFLSLMAFYYHEAASPVGLSGLLSSGAQAAGNGPLRKEPFHLFVMTLSPLEKK